MPHRRAIRPPQKGRAFARVGVVGVGDPDGNAAAFRRFQYKPGVEKHMAVHGVEGAVLREDTAQAFAQAELRRKVKGPAAERAGLAVRHGLLP